MTKSFLCVTTLVLAAAVATSQTSPQAGAEALHAQARAAAAAGDVDKAVRLLEGAAAMDPNSAALRDLAALEAARGRLRESFLHLHRWLELHPDDAEARRAAATAALHLRRPDAAATILEPLPEEEPANRMLRGRVHLQRHEHDAVVETLAPLVANPEGPLFPDALQATAMAELEAGRPGRVVELARGHENRSPGLRLLLGQGLHQSGESEDAANVLEPVFRAIAEENARIPADFAADVAAEYGRILLALDRREQAVEPFRLATRLQPEDPHAWESLSQTLARLGRMDEAKEALAEYKRLEHEQGTAAEKALAHDRALEDPTLEALRRSAELFQEGNLAEARQVLEDERILSPADPRPATLLARILRAQGSPREAFRLAEEAVRLAGDREDVLPHALLVRAQTRMANNVPLDAEADFQRALEMDSELVDARLGLARVEMLKGDPAAAREQLDLALEIAPDHAGARLLLRQLETEGGGT